MVALRMDKGRGGRSRWGDIGDGEERGEMVERMDGDGGVTGVI